ncbi:hypothetical protein SCOCK_500046 [Actinacidiphila cocklensis]|uniref:Uncharacterized protein n=1 Tax=Actinacidiphila cocklensis TaxID=887465 RepID=A0A9W4DT53_9ACTN|nr:hypothetical protein SCOCK_500046 [Actinacidiphila cocklensis]
MGVLPGAGTRLRASPRAAYICDPPRPVGRMRPPISGRLGTFPYDFWRRRVVGRTCARSP